ncbi:ABC transporter permease [Pseudonocardia sp. RS010]|uniref:ABC transporter permease n=1 Tax=Pseudonocardia sp. RS010 TaxID=3385979 RepID=UPI00399FA55D
MTATLERPGPDTARPGARSSQVAARSLDRTLIIVTLVITGVLTIAPVVGIFRKSLEDGARGAQVAFTSGAWGPTIVTTIELAAGSLGVALVLGTSLAWCAHRLPPGRRWMSLIPVATLFVPAVALATGWAFMLSPDVGYLNTVIRAVIPLRSGPFDVYSKTWIILLTGLAATAFVFLFVRSGLAQLHQELIDAATASGASTVRIFGSVILPLIRPALIYGAATTLLISVGQVTMPLILGRQASIDVLSTQMLVFTSRSPIDYGAASTFGLPIVALGLVVLVLQRSLLRDQSRFVTTGSRAARPMARTRLPGQIFLLLFGLVSLVLPLLGILYVSFSPFWTNELSFANLGLQNYRDLFADPSMLGAVRNTVVFSLIAVAITLPLSHICARIIYRRSKRPVASALQDLIISLPLGIPGVIFGMGFLVAYTSPPIRDLGLYGTTWSMVLVYITLQLPFTTRMQLTAMANIGEDLSNAAAANGAGWIRRTIFIDIPMLRPALGASAALSIALIAQEFSASLLVRSLDTQVLATALYDRWAYGSFPATAVLAVFMCVITGLGVALAFLLGGRSSLEGIGGRGA